MKTSYKKINSGHYSLGELVEIVSSCAKDSRETLAALVDLFESGRVCVSTHGRLKRVKVAT
jgi:predicted HTH domain antitoxin